jgi:hypothetical protein
MNEGTKQRVDTSSAEFNEGVEAGLNSTRDTKNWKAGNELGQQLKAEDETEAPLFTRYNRGGDLGNDQDEKDEAAE